MEEAIARYKEIQEKNLVGGGVEHIERQHNRGKLTARERIDVLVDPGTAWVPPEPAWTAGCRLRPAMEP
jgi:acetyl-CoA carboxylase carboxyltransferase component